MSRDLDFCINKSGQTVQLYDVENGKNIGALNNREAFILFGHEGDLSSVVFLGPNGQKTSGTVFNTDIECLEIPKTCLDYPYGTVDIEDEYGKTKKYYTFIMRRTMNIYKNDGTYWGKVAENMLVATNTSTVGEEHNDWKEITYVQHSPDRNWVKVDKEGAGYGFVDTGIFTVSSNYAKIPFYGSW